MQEFGSDVVAFLHTRNRPEFAIRAIQNFRKISDVPIIILDASDELLFQKFQLSLDDLKMQLGLIQLLHHESETPIAARFQAALAISTSKAIYLMADDDLILPGFPHLVEFLISNSDSVAVYGEAFSFRIAEGFNPYGTLNFFDENRPNPEAAWLEDQAVEDRLREVGRRPLSTLGWYALHLRDSFEVLVEVAQLSDCSHLDFEFILNVLQPILGKVIKVPVPALARQINPDNYLRVSTRSTQYKLDAAPLIEISATLLFNRYSIAPESGRRLVMEALEMDRLELEAFAWRQIPFVNFILGKYPSLNNLVSKFRNGSQSRFIDRDLRFQTISETSFLTSRSFVEEGTKKPQL